MPQTIFSTGPFLSTAPFETARILVMILAGGEGRRLGPLTNERAKPAVPFGGRYRIVPNGVAVPDLRAPRTPADRLRLAFVGQAVERKGLPVLLRAFEALREHIPVELTVVGANRALAIGFRDEWRGLASNPAWVEQLREEAAREGSDGGGRRLRS